MAKPAGLIEISQGNPVDIVLEEVGAISVVASRAIGPYVVFAQPKATEQWTSLARAIPGLKDGDPCLVRPDPEKPVLLQPLRFTMMACTQYWLQTDPKKQGARIDGVNPSLVQKPRSDGPYSWLENVFAAAIVYVPVDGKVVAVPATVGFKTVKCPAALSLKLAIEEAEKPEWAEQSMAHKAAFQAFAKPWLRVVAAVNLTPRSGTGNPYVAARSVCAPAGPEEYRATRELMASEDGMKSLRGLKEHYLGRLKELGIGA